jgi:hypothetical protein
MTQQTSGASQAPIACTLDSTELGTQVERWKTLYADAGTDRAVTDDGLRVRFRRDPAVERDLRDLVAVESACCAWADWTVSADGRHLVLAIRSTGDGASAIRSWFSNATTRLT